MKKYLIIFLFFFGIGAILWSLNSLFNLTLPSAPSVSLTPASSPLPEIIDESPYLSILKSMEEIKVGGEGYRFSSVKVSDVSKLQLFSNLETKKAAKTLREEKDCRFLVNGSYYSRGYQPLGWLVSQGEVIYQKTKSELMNGFLSTKDNKAYLGVIFPKGEARIGLQSGPLLVERNRALPLKIRNDERARRIVVGLNKKGELLFMVFVAQNSISDGPFLSQLPEVVVSAGRSMGQEIEVAVNLDGGGASAFLSEKIELDEISIIGSYFCLR